MRYSLEDSIEIVIFYQGLKRGQKLGDNLNNLGIPARVVDDFSGVNNYVCPGRCAFAVICQDDPVTVDANSLIGLIHLNKESRFLFLLPERQLHSNDFLTRTGGHLVMSNMLSLRQISILILSQVELLVKERQNISLRKMLDDRTFCGDLVGGSLPMRSLYRLLDRIAQTDSNVMITGEHGTELSCAARTIHQRSERRMFPIVMVDCFGSRDDPDAEEIFGVVGSGPNANAPCPKKRPYQRPKGGLLSSKMSTC